MNLKWLTTLQQRWTKLLAPTMWTLASVKRDLDGFLGPKMTSTTWNFKLKVFKREDKNAEFRLRQNFSMGESDFNQCIRQRYPLGVAADNFLRGKKLSPVLQSTLCKNMQEQLKLVYKVINVVDRPNIRIFVTLLQYKADNSEPFYPESCSILIKFGTHIVEVID